MIRQLKFPIVTTLLLLLIINKSNSLNIPNRLTSTINRLMNKDLNNNDINDIPKIEPLEEKKRITTKLNGIINNIVSVPLIAVKSIKDVTYVTIDTAYSISNKDSYNNNNNNPTLPPIIPIIEETKENIVNVRDAIIDFPSNIVNDVTISIDNISSDIVLISNIPSKIISTTKKVKSTVKTVLKVPSVLLGIVKKAIDSIYDFSDRINGIDEPIPIVTKKTVASLSNIEKNDKTPFEIINDIKDAAYMTADTVSGTITNGINTIQAIPTIPSKVVNKYKQTKKDINDKFIDTQNGLINAKENSIKIGKVFYKIITLEAAKETAANINSNYKKLVSFIDNPKAAVVNLTKPKPFPSANEEVSAFDKISNAVVVVGETVKVTGAIANVVIKVSFTIFEGIRKVTTLLIEESDNELKFNNAEAKSSNDSSSVNSELISLAIPITPQLENTKADKEDALISDEEKADIIRKINQVRQNINKSG